MLVAVRDVLVHQNHLRRHGGFPLRELPVRPVPVGHRLRRALRQHSRPRLLGQPRMPNSSSDPSSRCGADADRVHLLVGFPG
mgnify:CR=1 FL=1